MSSYRELMTSEQGLQRWASTLERRLGALDRRIARSHYELISHDSVAAEVSLNSSGSAFTSLTGGPEVTVDVPEGALVLLRAKADLKGSGTAYAQLGIDGGSGYAAVTMLQNQNNSYRTGATGPGGVVDLSGGAQNEFSSGLAVISPGAGERTFEVQYAVGSIGAATVTFKNRELWVVVMGEPLGI